MESLRLQTNSRFRGENKIWMIEDCTSIQEEEMNMFPWLQIIAEIIWEKSWLGIVV